MSGLEESAVYWLPAVAAVLILAISAWAATAWVDRIVEEEERRKRDEGD